jgi:hypothetical protein
VIDQRVTTYFISCRQINPPSIAVKRENETEQATGSPPAPRRNLRKRNPVQPSVNMELQSESDEDVSINSVSFIN